MDSSDLAVRAAALEDELAEVRRQLVAAKRAELREQLLSERLVYAADSRCPCGLGLAYDPAYEDADSVFVGPLSGFWDCSGILLGTADRSARHTDRLPFAFYEILSEGQPSAYGRTTRPK